MLDRAIVPYLVLAILICLVLLSIIVVPAIIKLHKSINELIRIGGEEDRPDQHSSEGTTEPMLNDYLNRRPR